MRAKKVTLVLLLTTLLMSPVITPAFAEDANSANLTKNNQNSSDSKDSSESRTRCKNENRNNESKSSNEKRNTCPRLTSIVITPATNTIYVGTVETLTVSALDQFGNPITVEPEYRWSATGTGTLVANGNSAQYTAGSTAETVVITVRLESLTATSTTTVQIPVPIGPTQNSILVAILLFGLFAVIRLRNRKLLTH